MNPTTFFRTFLNNRGLQKPNGIPLYSYKLTTREYIQLSETLSLHSQQSEDWNACFVLFATEWWRKNPKGGAWSWDPIMNAVNKSPTTVLQRNRIVTSGFQSWKREVQEDSAGNDYLGTVIIESGLPLKVLTDNHYLATLITTLYRELGAISGYDSEYLDIVKGIVESHQLPQTLCREQFYKLLIKFVGTLVFFNEKYGFAGTDSPVETLDKFNPEWRDRFPIRIDHAGKLFIDQILAGVSKELSIRPQILELQHELITNGKIWTFQSTLLAKSGIYHSTSFGIGEKEFERLSYKLEIFTTGHRGEQRVGFAFKNYENQCLQLDGIKLKLKEDLDESFSALLIDTKNCKKVLLNISNNHVLTKTEPLIFESLNKSGERWTLKVSGSCQLKQGKYMMLVLPSAKLKQGIWEKLTELTTGNQNFILYQIQSSCIIEIDTNFYSINFNDSENNFYFDFLQPSGSLSFYIRENSGIHLGWPKFFKIRMDGVIIGQVRAGIEVAQANGQWRVWSKEIYGKMKIRLVENNTTLLSKYIEVLPENFKVEFESNKRKVILRNSGQFKISVESDSQNKIEKSGPDYYITFSPNFGKEDPGHFIALLLIENGNGKPVKIKIPFPSEIVSICGTDQERLINGASLYLNHLYGSRLFMTNLGAQSKTFKLELSLANTEIPNEIKITRLIKVPGFGNTELPLFTLKDIMMRMLSVTDNIHSTILVSCQGVALEVKQFQFEVYVHNSIIFQKTNNHADSFTSQLSTFRLDQPYVEGEQGRLQRDMEKGGWNLPATTGLWFIYPPKGAKQIFKPIAYRHTEKISVSDLRKPTQFHHAALLNREPRIEALRHILDKMALDFEHPDWRRLDSLFEEIEHLPLNTHDIFCALSDHREALITACLALSHEVIERMSEEFAITWLEFPMHIWISAFEKYKIYLLHGIFADLSEQVLSEKLDWLAGHFGLTSLKWILERHFKKNDSMAISGEITKNLLRILIHEMINGADQKMGLRGRHADNQWPDQLNIKLGTLVHKLPQFIDDLLPDSDSGYQKGVIYLPYFLAVSTLYPEMDLFLNSDSWEKFQLRQLIDFDQQWLISAYNLIIGYLYTDQKNLNSI